MDELSDEVMQILQNERERASDKHGKYFNSRHEAIACIYEEYFEVKQDLEDLKSDVQHYWDIVRYHSAIDDYKVGEMPLKHIVGLAVELACEAIQLAGVADKERDSIEYRGYGSAD